MNSIYRFYKEGERWYIDLPDYPGSKAELEMVAGADSFLEEVKNKNEEVIIEVSPENAEGFDELQNLHRDDIGSGAYYLIRRFRNQFINHEMWLCDVTKYVFGEFPERIFIKVL